MDVCSREQPSGLGVTMSPGAEASRRPLCLLPSEWVPLSSLIHMEASHGRAGWSS